MSQDMIALRISPDIQMAVVAAPSYLERHPAPRSPQDLTAHSCINLRLPRGAPFAWVFRTAGKERRVKVDGQLVFNTLSSVEAAALAGFGLAYLPRDRVAARLAEALTGWHQTFEGYHLYCPNRRHPSPAFALLVEALKVRG